MGKRHGCSYCFRTLDPDDLRDEFRTFVECSQCGAIYHGTCWRIAGKCLLCTHEQAKLARDSKPPSLRTIVKTRALPMKSSAVVWVRNGEIVEHDASVRKYAYYLVQEVWAVLLAVFLVALASSIGIFTHRVLQLNVHTAQGLMDAIFRENLSPLLAFVAALTAGVIYAWVFYGRRHTGQGGSGVTGFLMRFIAGIIALASADIVFLELTLHDLASLDISFGRYEETLYAQAATVLIVLLLTPLHRKLAPITYSPKTRFPRLVQYLYGWTRLSIVSLLLALFSVYLSVYQLLPSSNTLGLADVSLGFLDFTLTIPMLGAFISGMTMASIVFWIPKSRQPKEQFTAVRLLTTTLRLLVVVLGVALVGFLYSGALNPENYLAVIAATCVAMLVMVPIQRSLS